MTTAATPALNDDSALFRGLNPEQRRAVTFSEGSVLVLAGAGSGKTRVLTTRMAWLLSTGQASAASVLAVTFTNKAAKEMLHRLESMLPVPVRSMWVGTFHGLCHRFLRAHWKRAGLPQSFQILDSSDQLSAIKRVMKTLGVNDEQTPARSVAHFISASKEDAQRPGDITPHDAMSRTLRDVYEAYEAQCQREGVVDFGELMLRTYEVLRDDADLRRHYQSRFSHILVDEFQDTNKLQYAWLRMLSGPQASVMAVGDDDQSIYAFRGAQVANMSAFEREFAKGSVVRLEQNYRSAGHILDAANGLIEHNTHRMGKVLRTDAAQGEKIRVYEAPSDFDEAQWVVDELRQLHRSGLALGDMALLYRSNAQSRVLEGALFQAQLPYKVFGGLRFFERAEIKHALAYLRLLANPNDDNSFLRVVNFPVRGIGTRTIENLQELAEKNAQSLMASVHLLSGAAAVKVRVFAELIEQMRAQSAGQPLGATVAAVIELSGLVPHYRKDREGADRLENLEELVRAAESFVSQERFGQDSPALEAEPGAGMAPDIETGEVASPLDTFLTHAALEAGDHQADQGQDAVQLMTVHASKGLEFSAVFVTGLEDGLFPHDHSRQSTDALQEERRLMYVAITRARQRLYLTHSQSRMLHGKTQFNLPSPFLDEIPQEALHRLSPKRKASSGWGQGGWGQTPNAWNSPAPTAPAATAAPMLARTVPGGWRIGQAVFHAKFGEGVITQIEGKGDDARVLVQFGRHGAKWLALSIAKLTAID